MHFPDVEKMWSDNEDIDSDYENAPLRSRANSGFSASEVFVRKLNDDALLLYSIIL